jgi:hypothetical protein
MGASESSSLDEKYFGFRIYKVIPGGPLEQSGVRELEDFIIPPQEVFQSKIPFYDYIRNNANKQVSLNIYSVSRRVFRNLTITPNNNWGNQTEGFLGASVRYENWFTAHQGLLRVIKVRENSLSQLKLNLKEREDYIIALRPENHDIITLNKEDLDPLNLFTDLISQNINKQVEFFIYNLKTGGRNCKILLEKNSQGEVLGCDVAYGKLHEFPKVSSINQLNSEPEGHVESLDSSPNNAGSSLDSFNKIKPEEEDDIIIENENKNTDTFESPREDEKKEEL